MAYSFHFPFLLISILFIQTTIATNPLFHFCFNSENFTTNSPYEKNLNKLLNGDPTGYGFGSTGQHQHDRVYGLWLCRGDVSKKDCKACVSDASSEILKRCSKNKGAIIWYDNCYLKYSDSDFFGKIDYQNQFYMWNVNNVSIDPKVFNQKTKELLTNLSIKACGTSRILFGSGELEVNESKKIYGMVQCSRDLSSVNCKKCLDDAISKLPSCCDGKQGGRVVGGSCNIRYEIYPFLNLYY